MAIPRKCAKIRTAALGELVTAMQPRKNLGHTLKLFLAASQVEATWKRLRMAKGNNNGTEKRFVPSLRMQTFTRIGINLLRQCVLAVLLVLSILLMDRMPCTAESAKNHTHRDSCNQKAKDAQRDW